MVNSFLIFLLIIIISNFFIIFSLNPIHSILWLVFIYINSAAALISINIEFIPLILIIVYVGAIAILFCFALMMLDTLNQENFNVKKPYSGVILVIIFIIYFSYNIINTKVFYFTLNEFLINWDFSNYSDFHLFANSFYTSYFIIFTLITIILLIGLIGVLWINLQSSISSKHQFISQQQQRTLYNDK